MRRALLVIAWALAIGSVALWMRSNWVNDFVFSSVEYAPGDMRARWLFHTHTGQVSFLWNDQSVAPTGFFPAATLALESTRPATQFWKRDGTNVPRWWNELGLIFVSQPGGFSANAPFWSVSVPLLALAGVPTVTIAIVGKHNAGRVNM